MLRSNEPHADTILQQAADTGRFLLDEEWLFSEVNSEHSPALIAKAAWHGFLPMFSKDEELLLIKMHTARTILEPGTIHVGRQSRKKAAQFRISVNEAFDEVVRLLTDHTFTHEAGDCWLTPAFSELYKAVNQLPDHARRGVRFYSVELWHKASGKLAAGEIGYTVGSIYSSCTGFALKKEFPGSGTLQLCALGRLLRRCGFQLWDLGMEMDYKKELGGKVHPRAHWIACVRKLRETEAHLCSQEASATTKDLLSSSVEGEEETAASREAVKPDALPAPVPDTSTPTS